ncbi:N-acetyl-alpha-D-glucosaminyl L-malate synthase [compost metagenome]
MIGGAGTYAYELALGLNKLDHDLKILTSDRDINSSEYQVDKFLLDEGIQIKRRKWLNNVWFLYWKFFLKKELRSSKYDLIIFANQGAITIGSKMKSLTVPYICTLHGGERYTLLAKTQNIKSKLSYNQSDLLRFLFDARWVIAVSNSFKKDVIELVPELKRNTKTVPLGISDDFYYSLEREPESSVLVSTARLVVEKGHYVLLDVALKLKLEGFLFQLYIIGNGAEHNSLQRVIKNNALENHVFLLGGLDRKQIANIYKTSDVFILLTQFSETFGLAYLEAMYSGLPVIGTNKGAIPEIVLHDYNGYLVEPFDVDNAISYIKRALKNKNSLGSNALKTALRYSNVEMARQHLT